MAPPKQRIQTEDGLKTPILRPVAGPVDTYVKPQNNVLEQLAQGLAEISPEVRQFSQVISQKTAESAALEGEQAARKAQLEAQTYSEATKKGLVPNFMNPWFMSGFKEQYGRVMADKWERGLRAKVDQGLEEGTLTSLDDFEKLAQGDRQEFLNSAIDQKDRDKSFEIGFGHRADAYHQEIGDMFVSKLQGKIDKATDQQHFTEIMNAIFHAKDNGVSVDDLAQGINAANDRAVALGKKGEIVQRTTALAIAEASHQLADADLFRSLMTKVGGGGGLASTVYGSKLINKLAPEIETYAHTKLTREEQAQKMAVQKAEKEVFGQILDDVVATDQRPLDRPADLRPYIQKLRAAGGSVDSVAKIAEFQKNLDSLRNEDNTAARSDYWMRIWGSPDGVSPPVTEQSIAYDLGVRRSISVKDAVWAREQLHAKEEADKNQEADLWHNYNYKTTMETLDKRFATMLGSDGDRIAHAKAELSARWAVYAQAKGFSKTNYQDNIKWLEENAQMIVAQQRGASVLDKNAIFGEAPAANLNVKDFSKNLLITPDDVPALVAGHPSENIKRQMAIFGIPPEQMVEFEKAQLRLYNQLKASKKKPAAEKKE